VTVLFIPGFWPKNKVRWFINLELLFVAAAGIHRPLYKQELFLSICGRSNPLKKANSRPNADTSQPSG